jgi:putative radical SAM enzyme (TIGR03279 family)
MENKAIAIKRVLNRSLAKKAGIKSGDFLLSVNGLYIRDIFDYQYQISNENITVEIINHKNGKLMQLEIEKEIDDDLGIIFENDLIDNEKSCHNKCIFCFIDQLPKGMRETLYFKDDDARLSFLTGNYVTLTNMSYDDISRIASMHFSPVNVSVHTTDPKLRCSMMNNIHAGDVMEKMKVFANAGIDLNCQIVLCKGINDKEELDKTIKDLASMHPSIKSISVVPVGITRYREGLYPLEPYTSEECSTIVGQIKKHQNAFKKELGYNLVYIADEFYIKAGLKLPSFDEYDGFYQIENGVGLMTEFMYDANNYLEDISKDSKLLKKTEKNKKHKSIATGVLAYPYIKELSDKVMSYAKNMKIDVHEIKNGFFGENVTVTGLLTGQDLEKGLNAKEVGDELLISRTMLKANEEVFLDDYSCKQLGKKLKTVITIVDNNGMEFIKALIK